MEPLKIQARKDSPEITFDLQSGKFSFIGVSHPENVTTFYEPVLNWLLDLKDKVVNTGLKAPKKLTFCFFFKYINSASYKYMVTIFQILQELFDLGVPIEVLWKYEPGDEDMAESGYELVEYSGLKAPFACEENNEVI